MKKWGWRLPSALQGIWQFGTGWLKPIIMAVPWITVGILLLMIHMIGGTMTSAEGVVFNLPDEDLQDGAPTSLVALVMPMKSSGGTYVFFDDARYSLGGETSLATFGEHLADRVSKTNEHTLLILADRGVTCEELSMLAAVSRRSGLSKVLFANRRKKAEGRAE